MKYVAYVKKHEVKFEGRGLIKLALDLAEMLDHEDLTISISENSYSQSSLAEMREPIFDDFCAVCCHAEVPIPVLEEELYKAHLLDNEDKKNDEFQEAQRIEQHVKNQLENNCSSEANICRAAAAILKIFPECGGYSGIKRKQLVAVVNDVLVNSGLKPVRPDYKSRKIKSSISFQGPQKEIKVLVFDDSFDEIIKTRRALAGWPSLKVEHLIYKRPVGAYSLYEKEKEAELKRTAQEILKLKPRIVLMDQGLGPIDGHEVILKIKELTETPPVFVGNTGGSSEELCKAGAIGNCDKGEKLNCVEEAIRYTNQK